MSASMALLFVLASAAMAAAAHQYAKMRNPGGDVGGYWATVIARWCLWVVTPLLVFSCIPPALAMLESMSPLAHSGWLILVSVAWAAMLVFGFVKTQSAERGRWLVGSIGFSDRRYWLIAAAFPFLVAIFNIGAVGTDPFGAVQWAVPALVAVALAAAAFSKPGVAAAVLSTEAGRAAPQASPPDWPTWMKSEGIPLELVQTMQESDFPQVQPALEHWSQDLAARGAAQVAPELIRTLQELVYAPSSDAAARCRLVFAAPGSGQEEVLALAASELAQRANQTTLIIGGESVSDLIQPIARWCKPGVQTEEVKRGSNSFVHAQIWLANAEVASDFLLAYLREELHRVKPGQLSQVHRIGLVVWWDVETYSGVKAATVWAVSRRLNRMLESHGAPGVRALAFAAISSATGAQSTAFVEHLLPYSFDKTNEVYVPTRVARSTSVYLAKAGIAQAAFASVKSGWPTAVEAGTDGNEFKAAARHLPIDSKSLDQYLVGSGASGAYLVNVQPEYAMALPDRLAQSGRYHPQPLPHYAALLVPDNPYLLFVVRKWASEGRTSASRLLVGAQGQLKAVKRHTQEAIREVPDTMTGLQETFLWKEDAIAAALHELFDNKQLHRTAVRFLDRSLRLKRDYLYTGTQSETESHPLETTGEDLIEVRNPSVSGTDGLLMRIDPERAVIDAYPRRVFSRNGRRYRVKEWNQPAGARIFCDPEDLAIQTWRGRNLRLFQLRRRTQTMRTGGISRYSVSAVYREELLRVIEQLPGGEVRPIRLTTPMKTTFETAALILEVATTDSDALHTIAMALRHVLPVHVGIDPDFMEVIALDGSSVLEGAGGVHGLAIVDLLPGGGIGLVEAIREDDGLIQTILRNTFEWLSDAAAGGVSAERLFSTSPLAIATGGAAGLNLQSAVKLLAHMHSPVHVQVG